MPRMLLNGAAACLLPGSHDDGAFLRQATNPD